MSTYVIKIEKKYAAICYKCVAENDILEQTLEHVGYLYSQYDYDEDDEYYYRELAAKIKKQNENEEFNIFIESNAIKH